MNIRTWSALFLVLLFFPSRHGFGDVKPAGAELRIQLGNADRGALTAGVTLKNAPAGKPELVTKELASGKNLASSLAPTPVNLWILVDASQLCQARKLDASLISLMGQLKSELNPKSLLSVVAFTGTSLDTYSNHVPLGEVGALEIKCDPRALSTTYEKALEPLLAGDGRGLPTKVWVYTSGNLKLSDAVVNKLKARDLTVQLFLYNPILLDDLLPAVARDNARLGARRLQLAGFTGEGTIPERWYTASLGVPADLGGKSASVEWSARSGGNEIAKTVTTVRFPERAPQSPLAKILRIAGIIAGAALVLLGTAKAYRYYRPRACPKCHRRRRSAEALCHFCDGDEKAYLVGQWDGWDRRKEAKENVWVLGDTETPVGNQRRKGLRVRRHAGVARGVYFRVRREQNGTGAAYRLEPQRTGVRVNGLPQERVRYLASGDCIEFPGARVTFFEARLPS